MAEEKKPPRPTGDAGASRQEPQTQVYYLPKGGLEDDRDRASDANLILIAHPDGELLGHRYQLGPGDSLVIGRSPEADISLPGVLSVSRLHARIEHRGDSIVITDLGSTNGTQVNERRVDGRHTLVGGVRIQTGAVHFKFLHEEDVEHAYHEAIHDLMMKDGLTDAFNKRKYQQEAEREFVRARRYERPLSLVLFDLDHFKRLNDTHGHLCGDYVLKKIGSLVSALVRQEQLFARVGGEEFAVLCPETTLGGAEFVAERLRLTVHEATFEYDGLELRVSCSVGVADVTEQMNGPDELYDAADQALYRSKKAGRNRVSVAGRDIGSEDTRV